MSVPWAIIDFPESSWIFKDVSKLKLKGLKPVFCPYPTEAVGVLNNELEVCRNHFVAIAKHKP